MRRSLVPASFNAAVRIRCSRFSLRRIAMGFAICGHSPGHGLAALQIGAQGRRQALLAALVGLWGGLFRRKRHHALKMPPVGCLSICR